MVDTLPDFPVDEVTLNLIEHALEATFDDEHNIIGAEYSLSTLLNFLSGYEDHDGEEYNGVIYTTKDVILALIQEVRILRANS